MISPNFLDKTDLELIELVKTEANNEAVLEVCRRYENIFYKICQKYSFPLNKSGIDVNDIFDEKYFIIFHCITSFNPSKKTKLSTWIGNYARYLCLNSINARRFILPSSDEEVQDKIESNQTKNNYFKDSDKENEYIYVQNLLSQLKDSRISQVFKLRYFNHPKRMIWAKIASTMGFSTQTAINLHNKGIKMLKYKIKSTNFEDSI